MAPTMNQIETRWKQIQAQYPEMADLGLQGNCWKFGIITPEGGYIELDQMVGRQGAWDWMGAFLQGAQAELRRRNRQLASDHP